MHRIAPYTAADGWTRYHLTELAQWTSSATPSQNELRVADTEIEGVVCAALTSGVILVHHVRSKVSIQVPFEPSLSHHSIALSGVAVFHLAFCTLNAYALADLKRPAVSRMPLHGAWTYTAMRTLADGSVVVLMQSTSGLLVHRLDRSGRSVLHSAFHKSTKEAAYDMRASDVCGKDYVVCATKVPYPKTADLRFVSLANNTVRNVRYGGITFQVRRPAVVYCVFSVSA